VAASVSIRGVGGNVSSTAATTARAFAILIGLLLGLGNACGSGESAGGADDPTDRPGACVCYSGSWQFRSCFLADDLDTCRRLVTDCNPFWYTNGDCSFWCPGSPEHCP
jgi:hypothetical protein